MNQMSAQSLRMAVVNAAIGDESFRKALEANPQQAISQRFGQTNLSLSVHFEAAGELPILLPTYHEQLGRSLKQVVDGLGDRSPNRGEFEALVIHQAWSDPVFKARLLADARGAITETLGKYSASLPGDVKVKLYEERPGECVIIVPMAVELAELSDAELEAVAGGDVTIAGLVAGAVVGAIAGKVVDVIWTNATDGGDGDLSRGGDMLA